MTETNEWIIEKKYIIHFPANINSLTSKQFLKLIELYYNRSDNVEFRTKVFFNIAKSSFKTKVWFWWNINFRKRTFADGDFEHVIKLFTDFLIENNEDEELLGKQLVPIIYVPKYRFLGKYGPKIKLIGFENMAENMSFFDYKEAEKAFFAVNLKEDNAYEMLISALYKGKTKDWQIRSIPKIIKKAVYFQYNDLREYWKRSYQDVFEGESSSSDEKTSDDVEENLQVWRHYVADEDPTKYELVDNQNIYNILFAWNEIRKRQKKEKELVEEQKHKR